MPRLLPVTNGEAKTCRMPAPLSEMMTKKPILGQCVPLLLLTLISMAQGCKKTNQLGATLLPAQGVALSGDLDLPNYFGECNATEFEVPTTNGSGCGYDCTVFRHPPEKCYFERYVGCKCIDGYFRHPETKKCVEQDQCPTLEEYDYFNLKYRNLEELQARSGGSVGDLFFIDGLFFETDGCNGANEELTNCGPCFTSLCEKPSDLESNCTLNSTTCKQQCICKCGYFRASNGTCVPKEQCPCFNNFEYLDFCAQNRTLQEPITTTTKPATPNPSNISAMCTGDHQAYTSCGPCFTSYCKKPWTTESSCNLNSTTCKEQCLCKCGYFKAPSGLCVLKEECPCFNNFEYLEYCAVNQSQQILSKINNFGEDGDSEGETTNATPTQTGSGSTLTSTDGDDSDSGENTSTATSTPTGSGSSLTSTDDDDSDSGENTSTTTSTPTGSGSSLTSTDDDDSDSGENTSTATPTPTGSGSSLTSTEGDDSDSGEDTSTATPTPTGSGSSLTSTDDDDSDSGENTSTATPTPTGSGSSLTSTEGDDSDSEEDTSTATPTPTGSGSTLTSTDDDSSDSGEDTTSSTPTSSSNLTTVTAIFSKASKGSSKKSNKDKSNIGLMSAGTRTTIGPKKTFKSKLIASKSTQTKSKNFKKSSKETKTLSAKSASVKKLGSSLGITEAPEDSKARHLSSPPTTTDNYHSDSEVDTTIATPTPIGPSSPLTSTDSDDSGSGEKTTSATPTPTGSGSSLTTTDDGDSDSGENTSSATPTPTGSGSTLTSTDVDDSDSGENTSTTTSTPTGSGSSLTSTDDDDSDSGENSSTATPTPTGSGSSFTSTDDDDSDSGENSTATTPTPTDLSSSLTSTDHDDSDSGEDTTSATRTSSSNSTTVTPILFKVSKKSSKKSNKDKFNTGLTSAVTSTTIAPKKTSESKLIASKSTQTKSKTSKKSSKKSKTFKPTTTTQRTSVSAAGNISQTSTTPQVLKLNLSAAATTSEESKEATSRTEEPKPLSGLAALQSLKARFGSLSDVSPDQAQDQVSCNETSEVFKACRQKCDTCQSYVQKVTCSSDVCQAPGCECNTPLFYRHPVSGECVAKELCPLEDAFDYETGLDIDKDLDQGLSDRSSTRRRPMLGAGLCDDDENAVYLEEGPSCSDGCLVPAQEADCSKNGLGGCFCKCGTFRSPINGQCIPKEQCPQFNNSLYESTCKVFGSDQCPNQNETFVLCGRPCGDSCALYRTNKTECSDNCLSPRCQCEPGYFRHPVSGDCVLKDDCPTLDEFNYPPCPKSNIITCTGPNEAYTDCGPSYGGDGCDIKPYSETSCQQQCKRGCFCACGYFRNSNGTCVAKSECPSFNNFYYGTVCPDPEPESQRRTGPFLPLLPSCLYSCGGENEFFNQCASPCKDKCGALLTSTRCLNECVPACSCRPGFARHPKSGRCIPMSKCPEYGKKPPCLETPVDLKCSQPNEVPSYSNTHLDACGDKQSNSTEGKEFGCFCRQGFCRNSDGICQETASFIVS